MKKNIIYSGYNGEYHRVIDSLFKERDWDPVFILGSERMRGWAKQSYKDSIFFEETQTIAPQFDFSCIGLKKVPLDSKTIEALSKYESFVLGLMSMSDATGWNFSFQERIRYYYDLLTFWNTVIQNLKPDVLVAWTWPHSPTNYVLYRLCKHKGIPVLFIDPVPLFNYDKNRYHYIGVSLEDQASVFRNIYNSDKVYAISNDLKQYLDSVRSKKGMTPPYITYFWENIGRHWNPGFWNKWVRLCWHLMKLFGAGKIFEKVQTDWKSNKFPFDSMKSRMNYFQYFLFLERIRRDDRRLKKTYLSFVRKPDLNKKYIYFASAFQPEAGVWNVYKDQFLILDMLTESIPQDWIIYFKEHPSQFLVGSKGSMERNEEYYKKISKYKNVQMVSFEEDSFRLIDGAQAVATPSGTVGWEAIVRNVPAFIWGQIWYQDCRSVFKIETQQDCLQAIEKIKNGYKPDQSDIERFAASAIQVCEKNIVCGSFYEEYLKSSLDPKFEMERIAKFLYEAYERNYLQNPNEALCQKG